jgi:ubiquinone/menaquinone biosynthesis C-methylase UbiE
MASTFTGGEPRRAEFYDRIAGWQERSGFLEWRGRLVADLSGDIVELGAGTGRNFSFYKEGARVFASDFDPVMLERAKARAREAQADVHLFLADAQKLPFVSGSIDNLVIGLMLCSVPKPRQALAEARRVLKPEGRLRFVEHVRDPKGKLLARSQDLVNPAWRRISGGCNMNRRTSEVVEGAGFIIRSEDEFRSGAIPLLAPHVLVEATPA